MTHPDVLVIGAGLSGLTCALELKRRDRSVLVVEAAEAVGGRVRTDQFEGFLLDRGFQVLLNAYPSARRYLDYEALDLGAFFPGALIWKGGRGHLVADPVRRPLEGLKTLASPIGTAGDKMRVGRLRARMIVESIEQIYAREGIATIEWLNERGYSERFIDEFWRPFYGGVLLDDELKTSSKMLEFTYKMFSEGETSLPARGMQAIPEQLADAVGRERIRLGARVEALTPSGARLEGGEPLKARAVVVATEIDAAARWLEAIEPIPWRATTALYFDAPEPPVEEPVLVLNGERGRGPVNNLCVPSQVRPSYAPQGRSLVSVSVLGGDHDPDALQGAVRDQLSAWFGASAIDAWRHLKTYEIARAQPDQAPERLEPVRRSVRVGRARYLCGDHRETSSIEGAMSAGRRAAEAVDEDLR